MKYQPFYDLPASQFEMLKSDIATRGVVVPIVVDEDDNVIDGHQRRRACAELHVLDYPTTVVVGLAEDEKQALALALNAFRRHLSGVERSQAIHRLGLLGMSSRQIAGQVGISHQSVLRELAKSGGPLGPPERPMGPAEDRPSPKGQAGTEGEGVSSGPSLGAEMGGVAPHPATPGPDQSSPISTKPDRVIGRDGKSYPATHDRSRAAVEYREESVRKLAAEGHTVSAIAAELSITKKTVYEIAKRIGVELVADALLGRSHRIDPNRVVEQTIASSGLEASLAGRLNYNALDRSRLEGWIGSLSDVIRSLTTLKNNLKKELTRDQS